MTTLFDACLEVARFSVPAHNGIATGGSTTTLVDATYPQTNGYFDGGVIFFITGNNAGNFAKITTYTGNTFTFSTLLACASGNVYLAFPPRTGKLGVWLPDLISAVNMALREIGDTISENATLTTVAEQEEYTLPAGVSNVRRVELSTETTAPYDWRTLYRWDEVPGGLLRFPRRWAPALDDYTLRLTYRGLHGTLTAATDVVSRYVDLTYLKYAASLNLLRNLANMGNLRKELQPLIDEAQAKAMGLSKPVQDIPIVKLSRW